MDFIKHYYFPKHSPPPNIGTPVLIFLFFFIRLVKASYNAAN